MAWLIQFIFAVVLVFHTAESKAQTITTCGTYSNWVRYKYYKAGAIVKFTDGLLYRAKYANPGYIPTVSTYYWEVYTCRSVVTTVPICTSVENWVQYKYYSAGSVVKFTDGNIYRAKYANPGYIPTVSTYFWERTSCPGATTQTPAPSPSAAPAPITGMAIPLPFRIVGTYCPLWAGLRITSIPSSYNQIYLFHAVPVKDGSGRFVFDYNYAVNATEIQTVRSRGQRVVLTIGGADNGFNFQTRSQSDNFLNSFISIVNSLGGQVDGIDFNNFEAHVGSSPTEMVYIAQQLKAKYGQNFSVSAPPAPDGNWAPLDRTLAKTMVQAGVMDYAAPQFYDSWTLTTPEAIIRYIDEWVQLMNGDASKVVVGFGANYNFGSNPAEVQQAWTTLKQKYPNLRGAFGWSAATDRDSGWTFGTYLGNNK